MIKREKDEWKKHSQEIIWHVHFHLVECPFSSTFNFENKRELNLLLFQRVTNSKSIQVNSCLNKHRSFHQLLMPFEKYKLNLQLQESSRSWFLMLYFQFEARKFPSPLAIRWSSPFNIMSSSGYPLLEIVTTGMNSHSIRASAWRRE